MELITNYTLVLFLALQYVGCYIRSFQQKTPKKFMNKKITAIENS